MAPTHSVAAARPSAARRHWVPDKRCALSGMTPEIARQVAA